MDQSVRRSRTWSGGGVHRLGVSVFGLPTKFHDGKICSFRQVKTELMKDLNNTLSQYGEADKKGVTDAYDLLQEKVQYCNISVVYTTVQDLGVHHGAVHWQ